MSKNRGVWGRCLAAITLCAVASASVASEQWPTQTVRLVVPYATGGTTDLIARKLSERLTRELGQTFVVDNKPGAATNIGAQFVAQAKPDGNTILFGSVFQVLNHVFGPEPGFDMFKALEPVSLVADMPFVLAANPRTPYQNGRELIAAAKAEPKKLSVSHAQLDISLELLNNKAGMELLLVPYKGGGPATTDAMAGQVNMVYALVPVLLPHIQAGKLKPLAVTSATRFEGLPNVPTFVESGANFDMTMWYGMFLPAGTPKTIVDKLARVTESVMTSKEMVDAIRTAGANPRHTTPADFRSLLTKELTTWQGVSKSIPKLMQK
ncbi:Bug family tripartite tricarboxylate transporter substrate binding protein [Ottowia thiooxydans]|uniref:Bug family tripartite tricarboxylate transporter substrate binding protein n=1 Tax=Ottowia thiooxydans TaxID=219182 RepID=UPI00040B0D07|nr:tripartite tricarboxylate transporter substrate binding protein [Ottowia thiooxydans]